MTELWVMLGASGVLILFVSFLFWVALSAIRAAHASLVESLRADNKALHSLLKDAQNRIHAASLNDYLTLQAHNGGTDLVDSAMPDMPPRSDAVEAEIAARMMPTGIE